MNTTPARYVVIGNPVAHSKSPSIHAAFAAQTKQNIDYQTLLAPLDHFEETVRAFIASGGSGANVTVPFKIEACALCDHLSERARIAGAVNTLTFAKDGIHGDNTDGAGLVRDIVDNAGRRIRGQRVLLLGAGGAARGVLHPLLDQQPAQLFIANRTADKAQELAELARSIASIPIDAGTPQEVHAPFDIVINATSTSLSGALPAVDPVIFGQDCLAYDMLYSAFPTPFMALAAAHGAQTRDGLGMLVEQAAEAFDMWRGISPETAEILIELREQLS